MNFTFKSESYGVEVEIHFEADTLDEIEEMYKQFLRGSGFHIVEDDMYTNEENSDTSEECVQKNDIKPVAYKYADKHNPLVFYFTTHKNSLPNPDVIETALYTAPHKPWIGLSVEDQADILSRKWWNFEDEFDLEGFLRVTEAKLKERNT